jgi:hypothetical protein
MHVYMLGSTHPRHANVHSYILRSHTYLFLCIHGYVSPMRSLFLYVSLIVPSLLRRLNSRDRIRTKLMSDGQNGIMVALSRFTIDPKTGENNADTSRETVFGVMDQSTTDPTLPKVGLFLYGVLLRSDSRVLACRVFIPKSWMEVNRPLKCR